MSNLIHIAQIDSLNHSRIWLYLRHTEPQIYTWFQEINGKEEPTAISSSNIEEAIRLARREWQNQNFQPFMVGYRFTLPERDEHGNNALFYQMVKSLNSFNGVYFDEELGHNAIIHQIPLIAREIYEKLKVQNRL